MDDHGGGLALFPDKESYGGDYDDLLPIELPIEAPLDQEEQLHESVCVCVLGHPLAPQVSLRDLSALAGGTSYIHGFRCDRCGTSSRHRIPSIHHTTERVFSYHCQPCGYDLCVACVNEELGLSREKLSFGAQALGHQHSGGSCATGGDHAFSDAGTNSTRAGGTWSRGSSSSSATSSSSAGGSSSSSSAVLPRRRTTLGGLASRGLVNANVVVPVELQLQGGRLRMDVVPAGEQQERAQEPSVRTQLEVAGGRAAGAPALLVGISSAGGTAGESSSHGGDRPEGPHGEPLHTSVILPKDALESIQEELYEMVRRLDLAESGLDGRGPKVSSATSGSVVKKQAERLYEFLEDILARRSSVRASRETNSFAVVEQWDPVPAYLRTWHFVDDELLMLRTGARSLRHRFLRPAEWRREALRNQEVRGFLDTDDNLRLADVAPTDDLSLDVDQSTQKKRTTVRAVSLSSGAERGPPAPKAAVERDPPGDTKTGAASQQRLPTSSRSSSSTKKVVQQPPKEQPAPPLLSEHLSAQVFGVDNVLNNILSFAMDPAYPVQWLLLNASFWCKPVLDHVKADSLLWRSVALYMFPTINPNLKVLNLGYVKRRVLSTWLFRPDYAGILVRTSRGSKDGASTGPETVSDSGVNTPRGGTGGVDRDRATSSKRGSGKEVKSPTKQGASTTPAQTTPSRNTASSSTGQTRNSSATSATSSSSATPQASLASNSPGTRAAAGQEAPPPPSKNDIGSSGRKSLVVSDHDHLPQKDTPVLSPPAHRFAPANREIALFTHAKQWDAARSRRRFPPAHAIENCDIEDCPMAWECVRFQGRESENIRVCQQCRSEVYYVEDLENIRKHVSLNHKFVAGASGEKYQDGLSKCCRSHLKKNVT